MPNYFNKLLEYFLQVLD